MEKDNIKVAHAGVLVVSKLLQIPVPAISLISERELPNKEITGLYSFEEDEIFFNVDWLNSVEWIEAFITAVHETRHAYQGYCVKTNSREPQEVLDVWKRELTNYNLPSFKGEAKDNDYLNQEIEIAAIAYTHWLVEKELGVKTVIPEAIKDRVKKINIFNIKTIKNKQ